ncbi:MAG: TSUP family transporter, partial [Nitratireductor sp.]
GPRTAGTSLLVGAVAGLLSGIASIPGPPVIIYWLASQLPRLIVRANLMTLFFLTEALSIGNIWLAGLFERQAVLLSIAAAGPYFVGLMIGSRLFGLASDKTYRRVTFVLIAAAALLALPAADPLFAALGRPVAD